MCGCDYKAELTTLTSNNIRVVPVHKPQAALIFVAIDQVQYCPSEVPEDAAWPLMKPKKSCHGDESSTEEPSLQESNEPGSTLRV